MRRVYRTTCCLALCLALGGIGAAIHLHLAAHEGPHSHADCPVCIHLAHGSQAVIDEGPPVSPAEVWHAMAFVPASPSSPGEHHRNANPRAPPLA